MEGGVELARRLVQHAGLGVHGDHVGDVQADLLRELHGVAAREDDAVDPVQVDRVVLDRYLTPESALPGGGRGTRKCNRFTC